MMMGLMLRMRRAADAHGHVKLAAMVVKAAARLNRAARVCVLFTEGLAAGNRVSRLRLNAARMIDRRPG